MSRTMNTLARYVPRSKPPTYGGIPGRRAASSTVSSSSATQQPPASFLRRNRRAIIWSSLGLALGGSLGTLISHTLAPPPHPAPGSHENAILMRDLETRIDNEFKVKVLRGKCTAAAANLRGEDGSWRELPHTLGSSNLTQDSLAGARALGVERLFWNQKANELVAVVWFGGATSGWPGVTHGGCIATVLCEKMALAARLSSAGSSITQATISTSPEVNRMEIDYKKPTYANGFYVVRMLPRYGDETSALFGEVEVDGVLETLQGKLCVTVTGTVPVSDTPVMANTPLVAVQKAKSWIGWPSRSDATQG